MPKLKLHLNYLNNLTKLHFNSSNSKLDNKGENSKMKKILLALFVTMVWLTSVAKAQVTYYNYVGFAQGFTVPGNCTPPSFFWAFSAISSSPKP